MFWFFIHVWRHRVHRGRNKKHAPHDINTTNLLDVKIEKKKENNTTDNFYFPLYPQLEDMYKLMSNPWYW